MEFEKSSLIKQNLLPHTEKNTNVYFVVDANLSIFYSDAIQVCVFPRFVLWQCDIRSKQAMSRLPVYNWLLPDGNG
jgi:hypothetical protein